METMPKIAALVVTYNRLNALQSALPQVLAEPFAHVLVVDNASTDGTAAWLAGLDDPRLQVLHLKENTGGAGGFAAGLKALSGFDWYVLADDDAWPAKGCLAAALSCAHPWLLRLSRQTIRSSVTRCFTVRPTAIFLRQVALANGLPFGIRAQKWSSKAADRMVVNT